MRSALAHCIKSVRRVHTRHGLRVVAEVELIGQPMAVWWMSEKQGARLAYCYDALQAHGGYSTKRAECHVVLDVAEHGERFVWCGMHTPSQSDLAWMGQRFGVRFESPYVGRYDLEAEEPAEVAEQLRDAP